jgi:chemotaxis protein histidine kinase CheA
MKQIATHAGQRLTELEKSPSSKSLVNEIFRDVHTIKCMAGSFGLAAVAQIAGNLEDSLNVSKSSQNKKHYLYLKMN